MNKLTLGLLCVACLVFMSIAPAFGHVGYYGYGGYRGGGGRGFAGIFGLLIFLFVFLLLIRVLFNNSIG